MELRWGQGPQLGPPPPQEALLAPTDPDQASNPFTPHATLVRAASEPFTFVHSFNNVVVDSLVRSFVCLLIYSFVHRCIHSSILSSCLQSVRVMNHQAITYHNNKLA